MALDPRSLMTTLACGVLLAACHLVAPYEPEPLDGPPRLDMAPLDGAAPDLRRDNKIVKPLDLKPSKDKRLDTGQNKKDGPVSIKDGLIKMDASIKDALIKDQAAGCGEVQNINEHAKTCGDQCLVANKPQDADCDGLADSGDPKGACNDLLLSDGFVFPPSSSQWQWTNGGSVSSSTCGKVTLAPGASITLKSSVAAARLTSSTYLVEARFSIKSVPGGQWYVRLTVANGVYPHIYCSFGTWGTYQPQPGLRHYTGGGTLCSSLTSYTHASGRKPPSLAVKAGDTLSIQAWNDGSTQTCRLLDSSGKVRLNHSRSSKSCPPSQAGTIKVQTSNQEIELDHVRAFEVK